jgi:curved DNA-binding protein
MLTLGADDLKELLSLLIDTPYWVNSGRADARVSSHRVFGFCISRWGRRFARVHSGELHSAFARRDNREKMNYTVCWEDGGLTRSAAAEASDISHSGATLRCRVDIPLGTRVYIEPHDSGHRGYGVVRHSTRSKTGNLIRVEFEEETARASPRPAEEVCNYYELLQISSNAEISTIDRIYRFLAARYHPDNPTTGDAEAFISITRAYKVLSDPKRRADYDTELQARIPGPSAAFESIDFLDGFEGEVNRRVAVLALLYRKCRTTPDNPRVSLAELETAMGFPREYLDFTTWYLRAKKYINREDNSDFSLTALGVDYVEENYTKTPILHQLLSTGRSARNEQGAGSNVVPRVRQGFHLQPAVSVWPDAELPEGFVNARGEGE